MQNNLIEIKFNNNINNLSSNKNDESRYSNRMSPERNILLMKSNRKDNKNDNCNVMLLNNK